MDADPAVRTELLTKRYRSGRPPALDAVDITLPAGVSVALVGPNGAGKSTLIRSLLGFERPTSGRALIEGIDPARQRARALRRIGYVGQDPGLYGDLSAGDHIALAGSLRRDFDEAAANQRLDRVGIERGDAVGRLSGGQQAQVALALALGANAPVLLLDEPLASLDPLARRDFLTMVRGEVDRGTTTLFASHIVGDLEVACDHIILLAAGRVVLDDTIAHVRSGHAIVDPEAAMGEALIGVFDDRLGRARALIRVDAPGGDPPLLDDIVLGYLSGAAGRRGSTGRAA